MFGNIKNILRNFNLKENNKPFIFLVCLFIASVLWLVNAMGKEYETTVSMPFNYTNLPQNKFLENPPPSRLNVRIKAQGFTLLRHKFGLSISPINFNVRLFADSFTDNNNSSDFFVLTNRYISQISNQINSEISILDILPDTLFFHLNNLSEKEVPIKANVNISFQNQFYFDDSIKISPEQIVVRGPSSIVDTITYIYTENERFNDLSSDINRNISLKKIDQLEYSLYKVNIEIPVSQYTEYSNKIEVVTFHVPDSIVLITFPSIINLRCLVPLDQIKNISPSSFIIGVDFNDIKMNSNMLSIKIFSQTTNIMSVKFQPSKVEYIIEKQ